MLGERATVMCNANNDMDHMYTFVSTSTAGGSLKEIYDDIIEWKHSPRNWPFVRGIHRSSVNSPHKGQWRGTLMFSLICAWTNSWAYNGDAGDLRRHDVIVIYSHIIVAITVPGAHWSFCTGSFTGAMTARVPSIDGTWCDSKVHIERVWHNNATVWHHSGISVANWLLPIHPLFGLHLDFIVSGFNFRPIIQKFYSSYMKKLSSQGLHGKV